ncbi:MAG: hypothetical protein AB7U98_06995 [Candidatus Nitrosocosmicus sp.]
MSLNEKCIKVLSVNIRHYFNAIIIPNNKFIFHKREGLPLKVSVESYLDIIIQCSHKIKHNFRIPIESLINWKIINGVKDGAFKHGYGLNSKYFDIDNENCAIYYPGIRGTKDDYKDKDILISIIISSNNLNSLIESFLEDNLNENQRILLTNDNLTRHLILHLKQKQGFLNKMYYESSITVKQTGKKGLESIDSSLVASGEADKNSDCIYSFDKNRKVFSVENKSVSKCIKCKLSITFQLPPKYMAMNQINIAIDTNRFLSSEYIKISNSVSEYIYTVTDRPDIDFDIRNNDISIDKLHISNCPVIKTKEPFWTSTAGSFPCGGGGNGNSVIYYSLEEKELSKSPVTLKHFERNLYEHNEEHVFYLTDEKKFWIVRKAIMGG